MRRIWCGSSAALPALVGALLVAAACARAEDRLVVFTAASLEGAAGELAAGWAAHSGVPVETVLGSTGTLAEQIRRGAPADVFLAADGAHVDALVEEGLVSPSSRRVFAHGRLALVARPGLPTPRALSELAGPPYELLAIAHPDHAPYGRAARQALAAAGLLPAAQARLVRGENVAQTWQYVRTGNADAGLVALALLAGQPDEPTLVPSAMHEPILHVAGVVGDSARAEVAHAFVRWLGSAEARAILVRHGLEPPTP